MFGSSKPLFGSSSSTSLFNTGTTTSAPLFGTTPVSSAPLFGNSSAFTSGFPSSSAAPAPSLQLNPALPTGATTVDYSIQAIVQLFGDDKDGVIRKLNQVSAALGVGLGYYKADENPVDYSTANNPFLLLKAVGSARSCSMDDTSGVVALNLRCAVDDLQTAAGRQKLRDTLFAILGADPHVHAHIDAIRPLPEGCQVLVYVTEGGESRRVKSQQLADFLLARKPQLEEQLRVVEIVPRHAIDEEQIAEYIRSPPPGFDATIWRQVFEKRPDGTFILPLAIRGFGELRSRQQLQLEEHEMQERALRLLNRRLDEITRKLGADSARAHVLHAQYARLSHRLTRVACAMHMRQRIASTQLASDEQQLLTRIETVNMQLNAPDQLKSHLAEVVAIVRGQPGLLDSCIPQTSALIDGDRANELQRYLTRCQSGLETLVACVQGCTEDLRVLAAQFAQ